MLIGEVASRTGVTTKALRFYERQLLLQRPPRTEGELAERARDFDPAGCDGSCGLIQRPLTRGGHDRG